VGANIGSYTVLSSGVIGCRTVAFEPDPATAAALERNISVNKIAKRVELRMSAVGDQDGEARFSIGLDTQNHVVTGADATGRSVPMQNPGPGVVGQWPYSNPDLVRSMSKAMKLRSCAARAPFWRRRTSRGS
jgi:hypothetical protein